MANLKKIQVGATVYDLGYTEVASQEAKGLMSASDKAKLDALKSADVTDQAIADAAQAAAEANGAAAAAQATADANTTLLGTVKSTAEAASSAAATAQDAADAAQGDVDAVEGRVDTLETSMGTAEANITAHGTKLDELEEAMKSLPTDTAITNLQNQVNALNAGQNLADMVGTAAELDGTNLVDGDKVQVIADENHDGASTVYKWVKADDAEAGEFVYVGKFGGTLGYTKDEVDAAIKTAVDEVESHANLVSFSVEDETLVISVTGHINEPG